MRRAPAGGTIALEGDYDDAMEDAQKAMRRHCNGPFTIVEEGEHVVGSTTTGVANSRRVGNVGRLTVGQSQTEQETEWRVQYVCGGVSRQAAPAAPSADPPTPRELAAAE